MDDIFWQARYNVNSDLNFFITLLNQVPSTRLRMLR